MERKDNRDRAQMRPVCMQTDFLRHAHGSCLITCGGTRVLCSVMAETGVPPFLRGTGQGWLTAEYAMLPASTATRKSRETLKPDGRSMEIRRLIGRALRQAVDLSRLGDMTLYIDCDVLDADGGTRTASITGAYVALVCAVDRLIGEGRLPASPITRQIAAVSAGIVDDAPCLDLCYAEDSAAQVDMNIVMDENGCFVEAQGTGEGRTYSRAELDAMLSLGAQGVRTLQACQREALGERARWIAPKRPVLVAATNNAHKLQELRAIMTPWFEVRAMHEVGLVLDVEETGATFAENAAIKAEAVCKATGTAAIGDDSGLSVDALGGAPGIYSARYAGMHGDDEANNQKLLCELADKPRPWRGAYHCAIALARPGRETLVTEGACHGEVIESYRGTGGFGYDPLFQTETGETFAEMSAAVKNEISHRARALQALQDALAQEMRGGGGDAHCGCQ